MKSTDDMYIEDEELDEDQRPVILHEVIEEVLGRGFNEVFKGLTSEDNND